MKLLACCLLMVFAVAAAAQATTGTTDPDIIIMEELEDSPVDAASTQTMLASLQQARPSYKNDDGDAYEHPRGWARHTNGACSYDGYRASRCPKPHEAYSYYCRHEGAPCDGNDCCDGLWCPSDNGAYVLPDRTSRRCHQENACINNPCKDTPSNPAVCTDLPNPAPDSPDGRTCTCSKGGKYNEVNGCMDPLVTSDGSFEKPFCAWYTPCPSPWETVGGPACAVAVCQAAGFATGTFISGLDMCHNFLPPGSGCTLDSWFYIFNYSEGTTSVDGVYQSPPDDNYCEYFYSSLITAQCSGVGTGRITPRSRAAVGHKAGDGQGQNGHKQQATTRNATNTAQG